MATVSYILTKVADPFSRYFGWGENQDHTYAFWSGPHGKQAINSSTTKTQTAYTPQEDDELCVECSNLDNNPSYAWNGQIKLDGVAISSVVAVSRNEPLIMVFKFGTWHEFSGQNYSSNFSSWKSGLKPPKRPTPPETKPIYLNYLHQRKLFYDPEDWALQKMLRSHLKRLFY